jgi:hypothetical protein
MEKKIEAIIQELKQYPREPKSLTWIESVLEKHLQEPTEKRKVCDICNKEATRLLCE